jgi:hypothetical protein
MASGVAEVAVKQVSVKIEASVYRMAKTVAAWQGRNISEYISEMLRPIVEKDLAAVSRETKTPPTPEQED